VWTGAGAEMMQKILFTIEIFYTPGAMEILLKRMFQTLVATQFEVNSFAHGAINIFQLVDGARVHSVVKEGVQQYSTGTLDDELALVKAVNVLLQPMRTHAAKLLVADEAIEVVF
jgi:hypothetical protein